MKRLVAGANGFIGRPLVERWRSAGHTVTSLVRQPSGLAGEVLWDGATLGPWASEIEGCDVVLNLAGRSVNCRYNERNKVDIFASRLDSTRVLGQAIAPAVHPPRLWLNSSTATIYRHAEDRPQDEATGELGTGFSVDVATKWESAFFGADTPRTRHVAMRTAMVMGPGKGGAFYAYDSLARRGMGGPMGSGRQMVSWVHDLDLARAIEFLWEKDLEGVVNISAPNPVPNREFMAAIADARGRHLRLPLPAWALTFGAVLIGTETELPLKSRWVLPGRLLQAGFEFAFPAWPEAARNIISRS